MTREVTYTAANVAAADRIAQAVGIPLYAAHGTIRATGTFNGRTVCRRSNTEFSYAGSNADRAQFEKLVASAAPAPAATDAMATDRQIAFLTDLIIRDPAAAMTVGASSDGVRAVVGLSKSRASRLIDTLLAGV